MPNAPMSDAEAYCLVAAVRGASADGSYGARLVVDHLLDRWPAGSGDWHGLVAATVVDVIAAGVGISARAEWCRVLDAPAEWARRDEAARQQRAADERARRQAELERTFGAPTRAEG